MPCRPVVVEGRVVGVACSRGRGARQKCSVCRKREAGLLCDGRSEACSVPLCAVCTTRVNRKDYCPACAQSEHPGARRGDAGKVDLGLPRTVRS